LRSSVQQFHTVILPHALTSNLVALKAAWSTRKISTDLAAAGMSVYVNNAFVIALRQGGVS
jgi:hypothetical protein